MVKPRIVLLIFVSGKVVLTGKSSMVNIYRRCLFLYGSRNVYSVNGLKLILKFTARCYLDTKVAVNENWLENGAQIITEVLVAKVFCCHK